MHIEILCEDKSGGMVLDHLMATILAQRPLQHTFAVRPHRGKGYYPRDEWGQPPRLANGLLDLLPAKLRAYTQTGRPENLLLVIVLDADAELPDQIQADLERLVRKFGGGLPTVIGISVEEIEAWLLGDAQAIRQAYPDASLKRLSGYRQDSVCGTWEVLASVLLGHEAERLIRIGYPAVGQYKQEWAHRIAPCLVPDRNQSPSFQRFFRPLIRQLAWHEAAAAASPSGPSDPSGQP